MIGWSHREYHAVADSCIPPEDDRSRLLAASETVFPGEDPEKAFIDRFRCGLAV